MPGWLRWQCRRGMLELDAWLARFLETGYGRLGEAGQSVFAKLLREADADLYAWLTDRRPPPPVFQDVLDKIKETKVTG